MSTPWCADATFEDGLATTCAELFEFLRIAPAVDDEAKEPPLKKRRKSTEPRLARDGNDGNDGNGLAKAEAEAVLLASQEILLVSLFKSQQLCASLTGDCAAIPTFAEYRTDPRSTSQPSMQTRRRK